THKIIGYSCYPRTSSLFCAGVQRKAHVSETLVGKQFCTVATDTFLLKNLIAPRFAVRKCLPLVSLYPIVLTVGGNQCVLILCKALVNPVGSDIFIAECFSEQLPVAIFDP